MDTESKVLGEEHSGFRKGRGGLENIPVMKEIIEHNKRLKKGREKKTRRKVC